MILEIGSGELIFKRTFYKRKPDFIECMTFFSHDGNHWFGNGSDKFFMMNLKTRKLLEMYSAENSLHGLVSGEFSPDNQSLLLADNINVTIWNLNGELIHHKIFDVPIIQASFVQNHNHRCIICTESKIWLWNLKNDTLSVLYEHDKNSVITRAFFSGEHCVVICSDFHTYLIDFFSKECTFFTDQLINQIQFSSDNQYLFINQSETNFMNELPCTLLLYDFISKQSKTIFTYDEQQQLPKAFSIFSADSLHILTYIPKKILSI